MGRILIVEDEVLIREGLVKIVAQIQPEAEILSTDNVREAMALLKGSKIDAFFLDIQLAQEGSGYELAKDIRRIERYVMTPIVFVTGVRQMELQAYRTIHCYYYLHKPFGKGEVEKILREIFTYGIEAQKEEPTFKLSERSYNIVLKQSEIMWLESKNRHLLIKTEKEVIDLPGASLLKTYERLEKDLFVQCHKSFIVNQQLIQKIDFTQQVLHLRGVSEPIPIGRKYKENLEEIWK